MEDSENPLKDIEQEKINKVIALLLDRKLGKAGRDFMELYGVTEETLPTAIVRLHQFADVTSSAGVKTRSADMLNEALYGYLFCGLFSEYEGRRKMDQGLLATAHACWEYVEAIAGVLDPKSYIFQCGLLDKFGLRETMRRRMDRIKVLFARIEKQEVGT